MAEDIRVRLTPEGVEDVLAGMKKIRAGAGAAARGAAADVGLLNTAMRELKSLLPTIGLAAAVTGIIAIGKHALNSADEIGKAAQRVGASAENYSVLAFAASTADVTNEQLTKGLGFVAKSIGALNEGLGEQVDLFNRLGLSAKDFQGKDTVEAFALISERLGGMTDSTVKTELALRVLGRGGQALIPLMNDLAKHGFANVRAEAEKLGLIISTDLAKSAEAANDSFTLIKKQAEGTAIQFVSGLAPAIVESMTKFREQTTGSGDGMKTLGEIVGSVIVFITKGFLIAGSAVATFALLVEEKAKNLKSMLADIAKKAAAGAAGGAVVGGAVGSVVPGVGTAVGAGAGAAAGAITGAVKSLTTPTPGATAQIDILGQFSDRIGEINAKIDPAELAKKAKALRTILDEIGADENLTAFEKTQKRLAEITKHAGTEQIAAAAEIARQRRSTAENAAQTEDAALRARLASTANLLDSQQQIEQAELASIARRSAAAKEAFTEDIAVADAKAQALEKIARDQYGTLPAGEAVITEITRQSFQQRAQAGVAYYNKLNALQVDFLNKARAGNTAILALDKQIADSRKTTAELIRGIEEAGFTQEQKVGSARIRTLDAYDALRHAVLTGNAEDQKKFLAEVQSGAKELAALGQTALAKEFINDSQGLAETGFAKQKLALQENVKAAEDGAAKVAADIAAVKNQVAELQKALLLNVPIKVDQESLSSMVKTIQEQLSKEKFTVQVDPQLTNMTGGASVPAFKAAAGGMVPGYSPTPRSDNIPAMLTAGEYVVPVRAVRHYGTDFFENMRNLNLPGFADGGMVGGGSTSGAADRPADMVVDLRKGGRTMGRLTGSGDLVREFLTDLQESGRGGV